MKRVRRNSQDELFNDADMTGLFIDISDIRKKSEIAPLFNTYLLEIGYSISKPSKISCVYSTNPNSNGVQIIGIFENKLGTLLFNAYHTLKVALTLANSEGPEPPIPSVFMRFDSRISQISRMFTVERQEDGTSELTKKFESLAPLLDIRECKKIAESILRAKVPNRPPLKRLFTSLDTQLTPPKVPNVTRNLSERHKYTTEAANASMFNLIVYKPSDRPYALKSTPKSGETLVFKDASSLYDFVDNVEIFMTCFFAYLKTLETSRSSAVLAKDRHFVSFQKSSDSFRIGVYGFYFNDPNCFISYAQCLITALQACQSLLDRDSDACNAEDILSIFSNDEALFKTLDRESVGFYNETPKAAEKRDDDRAEAIANLDIPASSPETEQVFENLQVDALNQVGEGADGGGGSEGGVGGEGGSEEDDNASDRDDVEFLIFTQNVKPKLSAIDDVTLKQDELTDPADYAAFSDPERQMFKDLIELLHKGTQKLINSDTYTSSAVFIFCPINAPRSKLVGCTLLRDPNIIEAFSDEVHYGLRFGILINDIKDWKSDPRVRQKIVRQYAKGLVALFDVCDSDFDLDAFEVQQEMGI